MNLSRLRLVILALAILALPAAASATPFQVDLSFGGFPTFTLTITPSLSISSADVDLSALTGPGNEFSNSAPVGVVQTLPPSAPAVAAFKMPAIGATGATAAGGNLIATFGGGSFDIATLTGNPTNPLSWWLSATFPSATLVLQNVADPANTTGYFYGPANFSGPSFDASGLTNPGYFLFGLGGETLNFDQAGSISASYLTLGYTDAPVPEPATWSLLLMGLGLGCALVWRRKSTTMPSMR